jgi:EAL domain-containing protein (putative c-di-GMP-specific phosphodiesterase class I)
MATTAEGVESKDQLDCLAEMGCDEIQGYYFGKPAPAVQAFASFRQLAIIDRAA